jgi:hypothetical protein
MNKRGKTLLKGHALIGEGAPHKADGSRGYVDWPFAHGKCSCGALSPLTSSVALRKQWHREHKQQIRDQS